MDSATTETVEEHIARRKASSISRFRPSVDATMPKHNSAEILYERTRKFVNNVTNRYVNSSHPVGYIEVDIHDLWYLLFATAKVTPANDTTSDRLAHQVLLIRELGQLSRPLTTLKEQSANSISEDLEQQGTRVEYGITSSSARIWTDLPFLASDLKAEWAASLMAMSVVERENLAGFTARLAALGVCDPDLASCALPLFREALETPRCLDERGMATDVNEKVEDVSISELLPALLAWMRNSQHKILSLSAQNTSAFEHVDDDETWIAVGELLAAEGQYSPGFNKPRLQFWKSRFEEISSTAEDRSVAEQALKCFNSLTNGQKRMCAQ